MTTLQATAADTAHIQVFSTDGGESYRWRVLAGNNRELARAASTYDDYEECVLAVKQAIAELPVEEPLIRSVSGRWQWRVVVDGECVATSGTTFDRRPRCVHGYRLFRTQVAGGGLRVTRSLSDRDCR